MNLTNKLQDTNLTDCWLFLFVSNHFSVLPYTFLVVQLVILIITCPFTIVLNVMVIFAVKKKRRLQTTSNIALACLATTDTIVGIFAYPIIISYEILILQGEISGEVCQLQYAARYLASVALFSSFVHLVLMTAERYIAIKHTLTHHGTITKTRVLIASVVAWIVSAVLQILGIIDRKISITVNNVFIVAFLAYIIFCNVMVYRETRRHEILILQGEISGEVCQLQYAARYLASVALFSSFVHLVLMTAERYIAIKHTLTHHGTITKTRVLIASVVAWIVSAVLQILGIIDRKISITVNNVFIVAFLAYIIFCNVMVYRETRRHERQIADQQVSVEARQNFLKDKKAFKVTRTVVVIVIFGYLPFMTFTAFSNTIEVAISTKVRYIIFNSAIFLALVNSLLNPLVYSVRLRQFRVALIEILLNKSQAEAEKFDDRRFGSVIEQIGKRNKDVNRVVNAADIELGTNQAGRQVRTN